MIALPSNVRVWLACGYTDMRRGFDGLASQVQQHLGHDPFNGQFFVFRDKLQFATRDRMPAWPCRRGMDLYLYVDRSSMSPPTDTFRSPTDIVVFG